MEIRHFIYGFISIMTYAGMVIGDASTTMTILSNGGIELNPYYPYDAIAFFVIGMALYELSVVKNNTKILSFGITYNIFWSIITLRAIINNYNVIMVMGI